MGKNILKLVHVSVLFVALILCTSSNSYGQGNITGPAGICFVNTTTQYTYTINGSALTSGYTWTLPPNIVLMSGSGQKTINVRFTASQMSGTISVTGNGLSASLAINVYSPPSGTGSITGASVVCPGQTGVVFSLTGIGPTSAYPWVVPSNATITSGSGTSSITVSFPSPYTSGTVSIVPMNGPCTSSTITKTVSAATPPGTPGTISGSAQVTPGHTGISYSIAAVANVTSYNWTLPSGATIASGAGTNSILVDFSTSFTGGNISVKGVNAACTGPSSAPLVVTLTGYPGPASTISGNTSPCVGTSGTTVTYSIPAVLNATSYNWIITGGATVVGSSTSNSININFPAAIPDNTVTISVNGVNTQGSGPSSTAVVSVYRPAIAPGALTGPPFVCPNQNGVVFSIAPVANVTSYLWNPLSGASIVSGQGSTSVTMNFSGSFSGGDFSIVALAGPCGGTSTTYSIQTASLMPAAAGPISGNLIVCQGNTGISYTVPTIENATGYTWSLPSGATIVSGQNTNSITVNYSASAAAGTISVYGNNCLGNGISSSKTIVMNTLPGVSGTISGSGTPCQGEAVNYSVPAIANATGYAWTVPSGGTIVSGVNTNSITVSFSLSASPGNITVRGTNCAGNGATSTLAITYATSGLGTVGADKVEPSVDLATGIMSTSIPLFSIHDGDVGVSGVLTYSATGIRVTDDDGWVGHNWSLSTLSYQISREVRGLPDDYSVASPDNRKGWLNGTTATSIKNFIPTTDNNLTTCSDEVANYNTLNTFNYNQDAEPDVFYVSAPGLSFQFYFDENKIPRALPYQDVIITPNTLVGPIASFTVKDKSGVLYTFAEVETVTQSLMNAAANDYYLVRQTHLFKDPITYTSAWRLSSVSSPIYGTVIFTYKSVTLNDPRLLPWPVKYNYHYIYNAQTELSNNESYWAYTVLNYSRISTIKILQKVSSPVSEAVFLSAPKSIGSLLERLNTIQVFDKHDGTSKLTRTISFNYNLQGTEQRAFLSGFSISAGCLSANYAMEYYPGQLPPYDESYDKDDWEFYLGENPIRSSNTYAESTRIGMLKKITNPYKGYDVFFYEPHTYWDGATVKYGAGIRLRKMVSYDGVSSASDRIQEYEYKRTDGQSSGKLQFKSQRNFAVIKLENAKDNSGWKFNLRYHTLNTGGNSINDMFTMHSSNELSHFTPLRGSSVAYERVLVKERDAGHSIYEFELPASFGDASANNNEWQASKVSIARPSTGTSNCFAVEHIPEGINLYPFPPDPEYEFARALLRKITDVREDGVTVRDVVLNYQRVYGNGTSIRKLYGLALEELPTYYYNGSSYLDAKLFLYSKYEVFTDVKTEISSRTETIYNSADLAKKTITTTNYFFDSPNHKELARTETTNSDGSLVKNKLKYTKDYTVTSPSGVPAIAIANLNTSHRMAIVESTSTKVISGTEKTIGAGVTLYQTISGKVYPYKNYSFISTDGTTTFSPSSISGGSTFLYDQTNYTLEKTYLGFDNFGNTTQMADKQRTTYSFAYGYNGTLPVIKVANAGISEFRYSDFETSTPADLSITWSSPTYGVGRNNSKGLNLPLGGEFSNMFLNSITYTKAENYFVSCWIKAATAGSISVWIGASSNSTTAFPFTASTEYKYYRFKVPVSSVVGSSGTFNMKLWSNAAIQIDDIAFYPEQADFMTSTYLFPYGKNSETDSRGVSSYFDYDLWGRLKTAYDFNKNVVKKYDYQARP
jgi:hypothetical protein